MSKFPAPTSPTLTDIAWYKPSSRLSVSNLNFLYDDDLNSHPNLLSPTLTPPHTPCSESQRCSRIPQKLHVSADRTRNGTREERAKTAEELPEVHCEVRARIPTTTGTEMWLHLYHNNVDDKEHLAIVFGPHIKSKTLFAVRPGETERDRMIRGAYAGSLYPGRTSGRIDQLREHAEVLRARPSSKTDLLPADTASSSSLTTASGAKYDSDEALSGVTYLDPPLVRIHSECYTGETVWSARCDCGEQLDEAARLMSLPSPSSGKVLRSTDDRPSNEQQTSPGGVIVYLRQEGRGIGLLNKLKAYNLQDLGHDTIEANILLTYPGDARSYGIATAILIDLGLGGKRGIKLLTNNPEKVHAVEGPNGEIRVLDRIPMRPLSWKTGGKEGFTSPELEKYISTKIEKLKHMFAAS